MAMNYYNDTAGSAITSTANAAAQQAYYDALARGSDQNTALAWAKFQWQQKLDEAGQTGMWNGQWNNPQQQWFTGQFGQWLGAGGEPQVGQQTLTAQQQAYAQAAGLSGMYGQYYAPGTTPQQGTATQQAQQQQQANAYTQAGLTGWLQTPRGGSGNIALDAFNTRADQGTQQTYLSATGNDRAAAAARYWQDVSGAVQNAARQGQFASVEDWVYGPQARTQTLQGQQQQFSQGLQTQQEARAAQGQQQAQTMSYLNLMSQLRGPADWAKYQQVLGATPGGMRDLVAAAMGQYVPGGGATTGVQPQAASLQSMQAQVAGQPYTGPGGGQLGQPNVYTGGQGSYGQGTGQVWGSGIGVGQQALTAEQQAQATGNGTNLPAPNQVAAQSWRNFAPSQQQLMLGQWESQGWDKNDVQALMNQSLPKYATNRGTAGTWRLQ